LFAIKPNENAKKVLVAGSFNNWQPVAMKKQRDGSFAAEVPADEGNHEYKFIVDGKWTTDPDNGNWRMNPFGTSNSVAILG